MDLVLIKMVVSTLDDIEVKGRDNLDKLLGCINALETFVQNAEAKSVRQEDSNG